MPPLSHFWKGYQAGEKPPLFTRCKACEVSNATERLLNPQALHRFAHNVFGVARCRAVLCPYCHEGQIEKSRAHLETILKRAQKSGFSLCMITLTIHHDDIDHPLSLMMAALNDGYKRTRQSSPFARIKEQTGLVGVLNVLEATYSAKGWNPHYHAIVITKPNGDAHKASKAICARYETMLAKAGYTITKQTTKISSVKNIHGLCNYLFKNWHHVTSAPYDKLRSDQGLTPFDLARAGLQGDAVSRRLFVEYFYAMKGRKQAILTPNLKKVLFKK